MFQGSRKSRLRPAEGRSGDVANILAAPDVAPAVAQALPESPPVASMSHVQEAREVY